MKTKGRQKCEYLCTGKRINTGLNRLVVVVLLLFVTTSPSLGNTPLSYVPTLL